MIRFSLYPDQDIGTLGAQAVLEALGDAGLSITDIRILCSGNLYQTNMSGQRVLELVGMTGIPVYNVANACASGSTAIREAHFAVASGAYDVSLAVGAEQNGQGGPDAVAPGAPLVASGEWSDSLVGVPPFATRYLPFAAEAPLRQRGPRDIVCVR